MLAFIACQKEKSPFIGARCERTEALTEQKKKMCGIVCVASVLLSLLSRHPEFSAAECLTVVCFLFSPFSLFVLLFF